MNRKYKIPESISDIKVKDYVRFNKAIKGVEDEKIVEKFALSILCGITDLEARDIPVDDMVNIREDIIDALKEKPDLVNTFEFGGIKYGLIPDWDEISFGEFLDLSSFSDGIDDMASIMSIMYRPIVKTKGDKYEIIKYDGLGDRVDIMNEVSAAVGLSLLFFCKNVYEKSVTLIPTSTPPQQTD